jgi:hypothetical protein
MVTFRDSQNTWQDLIKIYDTIFFNLIKKNDKEEPLKTWWVKKINLY